MMPNDKQGSVISQSARVYERVRCVNSRIGDNCCIGDDCDICDSTMEQKSELGRRNLIRNTLLGTGSYTGTNTIIKNAQIGRYCSISWNVSIGGDNHAYQDVAMYSDYWFNRTFSAGLDTQQNKTLPKKVLRSEMMFGLLPEPLL